MQTVWADDAGENTEQSAGPHSCWVWNEHAYTSVLAAQTCSELPLETAVPAGVSAAGRRVRRGQWGHLSDTGCPSPHSVPF